MNTQILLFAAFCVILSALFAILNYVKTKLLIRRIHKMLDDAVEGTFTESRYDETLLSALECKLWHYLSTSEISAQKTALEKSKIKTLIADISHQTKTPIANIQLYSELLAEYDLPQDASEYAKKIRSQSEKLGFLITSLVKLSRLETGILSLHPALHPLAPMLDEIAVQYADKAMEKGLTFRSGSTEASAVFDEKWTAEAIGNIVDNAVKYTANGGIEISVTEYEQFVCIRINDTGMGIAEEEQSKIFQRFYRCESAYREDGVGIGLYLAREILSAQDGYIRVTSEVAKGSSFCVFLPKSV